jgi:hypothetical protein
MVDKSKYLLSIYSGNILLMRYPVILGTNPVDRKSKACDNCTLEGRYYLCHKNSDSAYYKALSYPNIEDADSGLERRIISGREYNRIASAINRKVIPPQYTALGPGRLPLEVHGHGLGNNWTWGCIAM